MTQEILHSERTQSEDVRGNGLVNPKSFGVVNSTRVYRKLQTGDNRSASVSIPIAWTKQLNGQGNRLCGYVRMNRNPDGSILLEFE